MRRVVRGIFDGFKARSTRIALRGFLGATMIGLSGVSMELLPKKMLTSAKLAQSTSREALIIDFPENADFDAYLKDRDGAGVIVDFYANWCNPCMEALPKVLAISENEHLLGKKTDLLKINVDYHEPLVERFEVNMIPCLILIKGGKEVRRISGRQITEDSIRELYRLGEANSN